MRNGSEVGRMSSPQPFRGPDGGRIDRGRTLAFTFDGRRYRGHPGDTLASALLANGVKVLGRSMKLHRPRGVLSAGIEEPNALLCVDWGSGLIPTVRATAMPLLDGLEARSQNCFPSVNFDLGRVLDFTRALWPAGFYYKMFKWPDWRAYEWAVRRAGGLGRLPGGADRTGYRHLNGHCDLLVVGSGPAGLGAALEAARRGEDVLLVEQDMEIGGSLLHDPMEIEGAGSDDWLAAALAELAGMDNVRLMADATVAGAYDHNLLTIHDRSAAWRGDGAVESFWKVRARRIVLATGAFEQPMLFGNNDLPGIMLAGAVHKYATRFAVHCGRRVAGVLNNDSGWRSLLAAHDNGTTVCAIVDTRSDLAPALLDAAEERGIAVHRGATPLTARGSFGVQALRFASATGPVRQVDCDLIGMSGGLNPATQLYSQAGGKLRYDESRHCFVPDRDPEGWEAVGAASGSFTQESGTPVRPCAAAPVRTGGQWLDFQNDVTVADIELAVRENYVSVEHLKRYTTAGMAVDQGKTSNLGALTVLGQLTGRTPGEVGTTTSRPQFTPVTIGAIAGNRRGDFYSPPKRLAAHDWHAAEGAVFDDYGSWKRPACYGPDREAAIAREVLAVRQSVGLFDGSPLGKIEVKGPDAAAFLDRIYVNNVLTLKPGRVRYGLMLNENGIVIDDGVFVRIADDHFLVNTTSGNAERICAWLEEWHQCEFFDMQVVQSNVTSQWAVATLAGPHARGVLQSLPGLIDLSTAGFPHMSFARGRLADGMPYRLQRVSFSGEQSYELSVPSNRAVPIIERLRAAAGPGELLPIGVEALMVLRTEKGFVHVGVDTDGTTNPLDIGFGAVVDRKRRDFIGARSLARPNDRRADRRQLVGFEPLDANASVPAGAHFVAVSNGTRRSEGFVTSACDSPTLGRTIGIGLIERGFGRKGEEVLVYDNGRNTPVRIVDPCFYDPAGERMRA